MKTTSIALSLLFCFVSSCHALSASIATSKKAVVPPPTKKDDRKFKVFINMPPKSLDAPPAVDDGKASMVAEIFSLAKTIIGASCFGLPAAIGAYGNAPSAVISASVLVLLCGSMSAYGFSLIGRVCAYTGATSYQEAWAKTISPKSAWMVSAASILVCLSSLLGYSMVLTQTTSALFKVGQVKALAGLMVGALLPLCRLRELSRLAPFALLGIGAILFTVFSMGLRCVSGAYAAGGAFASSTTTTATASFGTVGAAGIFSPAALLLVSCLTSAFSSHYNAPKFYNELRDNTVSRYNTVVMSGYGLAAVTYILVATFGFLTFGAGAESMVLSNYASHDGLLNMARLAVAGSIMTSFPLTFSGVRDSLLDLVGVKNRTPQVLDGVTVALLSILSVLTLTVKNLGAVWAIGGATYGTALTVLIPPVMFIQCVRSNWRLRRLRREIPVAATTAVVGLVMGVIGTVQAMKKYNILL